MTFKIGNDWQDAKLVMTQDVVPGARTPEKGSKWSAVCRIDGQDYFAESRNGAPYALARELIAAGIPDQPVCVITQGRKMGYRSLQWMAEHTLVETKTKPLHLARFHPPDFTFVDGRQNAQNRGESDTDEG